MFPQIFLEQTTHQCLEEDILEMGGGGIEESRNEKSDMGMRKLVCFANFWLVNSEATLDCTLGLNNMPVSHQHFFKLSLPKI